MPTTAPTFAYAVPAAACALKLQIVEMGYSAAPNLFYNDGPAKKFTVDVRWNGCQAIECGKPELQVLKKEVLFMCLSFPFGIFLCSQYAPQQGVPAETVHNQNILQGL